MVCLKKSTGRGEATSEKFQNFRIFRNYFGRFRVFDVEKSDFKIGSETLFFSTFFDEILERYFCCKVAKHKWFERSELVKIK